MSKHYCNSQDLEEWWSGWLATSKYETYEVDHKGKKLTRINFIKYGDDRNWTKMSEMLYNICLGIAKNFRPKCDDEYYNLANEAMIRFMNKIKEGKIVYIPRCQGGSPVFNLATTTIHRLLCSYKNQQKNMKIRHSKFVLKEVKEKAPELIDSVRSLYE